jgi:hypothetical protein
MAALKVALDEEHLATGVIYADKREPYDGELGTRGVVDEELSSIDITETMDEFV